LTIKKLSENWDLTPSSIQLLENVIADTSPDVKDMEGWYKQYSNGQKKRLSYDIDYVERFASKGAKILEFGSVPPLLTSALTRLGYDVVGLDLKPDRFQTAITREKIKIEQVDFETEKLPFEDNSFDVAIFNEVFEHLRINPIFTLREVHRVLKKDGQLMLSTPNLMSWKGWYNFVFKSKLAPNLFQEYMKLEKLGHMGHVRLYSPVEVIQFLKEIGLKVEVIIHRGEWQSPSDRKRYWGNKFLKTFPKYRTFFSVVARKI
jgi:2-polyprenyl-3-methyl-5-hydroxy-6-metoxy-1,4-benzoquinol methylase